MLTFATKTIHVPFISWTDVTSYWFFCIHKHLGANHLEASQKEQIAKGSIIVLHVYFHSCFPLGRNFSWISASTQRKLLWKSCVWKFLKLCHFFWRLAQYYKTLLKIKILNSHYKRPFPLWSQMIRKCPPTIMYLCQLNVHTKYIRH